MGVYASVCVCVCVWLWICSASDLGYQIKTEGGSGGDGGPRLTTHKSIGTLVLAQSGPGPRDAETATARPRQSSASVERAIAAPALLLEQTLGRGFHMRMGALRAKATVPPPGCEQQQQHMIGLDFGSDTVLVEKEANLRCS